VKVHLSSNYDAWDESSRVWRENFTVASRAKVKKGNDTGAEAGKAFVKKYTVREP